MRSPLVFFGYGLRAALGAILLCTALPPIAIAAEEEAPLPAPDETPIAPRKPVLYIAGDSTAKNDTPGQMGWGTALARYFDSTKIILDSHAAAGHSSRTFQCEGLWDEILDVAQPGDVVLIQLGEHDNEPLEKAGTHGSLAGIGDESREIDTPEGRKETVRTYGWYMRKYITDARAKGMTPVVCAPSPRCPADKPAEANPYVAWSRDVAASEKALFIDLDKIVTARFTGAPAEKIQATYFTPAGGAQTNPAGADMIAQSIAESLRNLKDNPLSAFLLEKPAAAETK